MDPVPWRTAWHDALYAVDHGFYVTRGGPAAHFATATHGPPGRLLAEALLALWARRRGPSPPSVVADVGAGRGELATHLLAVLSDPSGPFRTEAPASPRNVPSEAERTQANLPAPRVVAVDVVGRPDHLDDRIEWVRSPGGALLPDALTGLEDALVIAHEWLDVVPCTIAEVDRHGMLREVHVDPRTGRESLGDAVTHDDLRWAELHWPPGGPGSRVEIGASRDQAWRDLVSRLDSGLVVAVDYGHTAAARPRGGTLTAYVEGRQVHPVPDGTCDVTAHVAMDTLGADEVLTQREALKALGLKGATPPHTLASSEPLRYLAALERATAEARLLDPAGFGAFWWAVRSVRSRDVP